MKIAVDTNVLLRDALQDDPRQSPIASKTLQRAELVVVPTPALCEFVWVMRRLYKRSPAEIALSIRLLMSGNNVEMDHPAVEADWNYSIRAATLPTGPSPMRGIGLGPRISSALTSKLSPYSSRKASEPAFSLEPL